MVTWLSRALLGLVVLWMATTVRQRNNTTASRSSWRPQARGQYISGNLRANGGSSMHLWMNPWIGNITTQGISPPASQLPRLIVYGICLSGTLVMCLESRFNRFWFFAILSIVFGDEIKLVESCWIQFIFFQSFQVDWNHQVCTNEPPTITCADSNCEGDVVRVSGINGSESPGNGEYVFSQYHEGKPLYKQIGRDAIIYWDIFWKLNTDSNITHQRTFLAPTASLPPLGRWTTRGKGGP